jgi:hypothetical protein
MYSSNRNGPADLFQKASNGSGAEEVAPDEHQQERRKLHGRRTLFLHDCPGADLWAALWRQEAFSISQTRFNEETAVSRLTDGGLQYQSNESGRGEVAWCRFPVPAEVAVSTGGGVLARWRRDGKEIFYATPRA